MLRLILGGVVGAVLFWAASQALELVTRVPTARDVRQEIEADLNRANRDLKEWASRGRPLADRRERLVDAREAAERAEHREGVDLNNAAKVARGLSR